MRYLNIAALFLIMFFSFGGCSGKNDVTVIDSYSQNENPEENKDSSTELSLNSGKTDTLQEPQSEETQSITEDDRSDRYIRVYICGSVQEEGVYFLPEGSIINDALLMAGGYSSDARHGIVNLAEELEDGMRIYFPSREEGSELIAELIQKDNVSETTSGEQGRININTADKNELMSLPGIGESRAADIISYREKNGGFKSIEEIKNISGIKDNIFDKIKDLITI
ncbi:competence protein ComEA [Eubacterium ruminantium]|nr:competence protein ComEA [Eubacterium ruminantium]